MNGAESLVRTLVACGVDVCFTNPGTSEMHLVAAIDRVDGMRPVLALFEGVVTGAADGYGRMAGKPACTLLHLGPGLGNGLANLHNARRARSPIVNIVGDHATYHLELDAPLTSDLEGIARTMSSWVKTAWTADELATLGAEAVSASMSHPGHVVTLAVPADTAWNDAAGPAAPQPMPEIPVVAHARITEIAQRLKAARAPVILLGGTGNHEAGLHAAGRIAAAVEGRLFSETFNKRVQRGAGRVTVPPVPYFGEGALEALEGTDLIVLAGAKQPVAFFAYPGKPSLLVPEGTEVETLATPFEDVEAALALLADEIGAPAEAAFVHPAGRPDLPQAGQLTSGSVGETIGALLPDNAIVVDEGVTGSLSTFLHTLGCPPHDWLNLTGGAIGFGLPAACGAAIACPDRKVICLEGDGSGMYTAQALWTMGRENLDIISVVFANRSYAILNIELMRVGAENPGPKALSMLDIGNPDLDWVSLAKSMGVNGMRADTAEGFTACFEAALREKGPHLIEAVI